MRLKSADCAACGHVDVYVAVKFETMEAPSVTTERVFVKWAVSVDSREGRGSLILIGEE